MTFASVRLRSTALPLKTAVQLAPGHRPVASSILIPTTRKPLALSAAANSAAVICGTEKRENAIEIAFRITGPAIDYRAGHPLALASRGLDTGAFRAAAMARSVAAPTACRKGDSLTTNASASSRMGSNLESASLPVLNGFRAPRKMASSADLRQQYLEIAGHWCDAADEVIDALEKSRPS
jgi:hypothetical protein